MMEQGMTEGVVHLVRHAMVVTCPLPWRVSGFTVRSSQEIFPSSALSSRCGHFWFKNLRMVTVTSCCLLGSRLIYWSPYKPGFKTKPILSSFTQHRRINMTQNFFYRVESCWWAEEWSCCAVCWYSSRYFCICCQMAAGWTDCVWVDVVF